MTTSSIVKHTDMNKDIFFEGNLVTTDEGKDYLIKWVHAIDYNQAILNSLKSN